VEEKKTSQEKALWITYLSELKVLDCTVLDVPEPSETPITIELNIPKPPGAMHPDSTGSPPSPLNRQTLK